MIDLDDAKNIYRQLLKVETAQRYTPEFQWALCSIRDHIASESQMSQQETQELNEAIVVSEKYGINHV